MVRHAIRQIHNGFWQTASLLIAAISVGWLIGLSTSSVLHIVVGSVVAVAVAIVGTLAGVRSQIDIDDSEPKEESLTPAPIATGATVNPIPIAIFALGLAVGSTIGLIARTNELFGPNKTMFVHRWQSIGLTDTEIKRRLFDQLYPPLRIEPREERKSSESRTQQEATSQRSATLSATLFATPVEDCQLLVGKHGADLRARLLTIKGASIEGALKECKDDCLEVVSAMLCRK